MERRDLTWDKIKELADKAIEGGKDFYLNTDFDGYVDVEIKTPTKTITQSQMEFIPKDVMTANDEELIQRLRDNQDIRQEDIMNEKNIE